MVSLSLPHLESDSTIVFLWHSIHIGACIAYSNCSIIVYMTIYLRFKGMYDCIWSIAQLLLPSVVISEEVFDF